MEAWCIERRARGGLGQAEVKLYQRGWTHSDGGT